jgi:hypothetical protein
VSTLAAALAYARRGWGILPVEPGGKRPLARLVPHGLKTATTDPGTILRWWLDSSDAGVGIRTGDAFDVLDIDGDEGWRTLARLVDVVGHALNCGPVAMTPGGGAHYYFRPTGLGNRAKFAPGLDWRGKNGYVVAAPSLHPNGGRYDWAISPDETEIPEAPGWLLDILRKPSPPPGTSASPVPLRGGSAYARAALREECGKVAAAPVGQRNDVLNRASFALAQFFAARLLDPDDTAAALLAAAARCGLGEQEARSTIASGFRAGLAQPRRVAS